MGYYLNPVSYHPIRELTESLPPFSAIQTATRAKGLVAMCCSLSPSRLTRLLCRSKPMLTRLVLHASVAWPGGPTAGPLGWTTRENREVHFVDEIMRLTGKR